MVLYRYTASAKNREEMVEKGTVLAASEAEARKKLENLQFDRIKLKRVDGISGLFKRFTADVR